MTHPRRTSGRRSQRGWRAQRPIEVRQLLLQLIFHFVDAGIDAGLVDPGRAGAANSANYIIAHLDRHAAADGDDGATRRMRIGAQLEAPVTLGIVPEELGEGNHVVTPGPGPASLADLP